MSQCNINVRIGTNGAENKQLYKSIDISLQMHEQKLAKLNQQYSKLLGKNSMPFVLIEYPQTEAESLDVFNFKGNDYEFGSIRLNNKLYQYGNPKNKDTAKLLKNAERQFHKIAKLNNNAWIKLQLYDIARQLKKQNPLQLLNQAKIKGSVETDASLIENLTEIVRRISVQFLNSPIMAFLQLLQQMSIKVELSSIEQFPQDIKETLLRWFNFGQWINKQNAKQLLQLKGELIIQITVPKLFSLKVRGQSSSIAVFLQAFSL